MSPHEGKDDFEALLRESCGAPPPRDEFVAHLHERLCERLRLVHEPIQSNEAPHGQRHTRRWFTAMLQRKSARWSISAAAAAGVIIAVMLFTSANSNSSLYAQIISALKDVSSLHAVGQHWRDGKWVKTVEVSYQQGMGVYEWIQHRDRVSIRIDDGHHEWRYSPDQPTVRKAKSTDPLGVVREILKENKTIDRAKRNPTADRAIDGAHCANYVYVPEGGKVRYRAWVDDQKRIRRFEEDVLRDGQWQPEELCEVQYDVPIEPSVFTPRLPENARIIDTSTIVGKKFDTATTVYTKEVLGLLFSIHRVERLEDGWLLVVSSLRPTEQTLRECGDADVSGYGSFQITGSFKRMGDQMRSYYPMGLATASDHGLEVCWTILEPTGTWPADFAGYDLSVHVNTTGKLADRLRSQGLQDWGEFKSMATLPVTPRKGSAMDAAAEIYSEVQALELGMSEAKLELKTLPFTDEEMEVEWKRGTVTRHTRLLHARTQPPSRITLEEYQAELAARIEEYRPKSQP